jgi:hypothetical protein
MLKGFGLNLGLEILCLVSNIVHSMHDTHCPDYSLFGFYMMSDVS